MASAVGAAEPATAPAEKSPEELLRDERRELQAQELITAKPFTYIFNAGDPPRIVWRDVETVRRLGCTEPLRVRWFDAELNESAVPGHPGRWGAVIETTAPNGFPLRRAMTFYCRPPKFFIYWVPQFAVPVPYQPGPVEEQVWQEHQSEIARTAGDLVLRGINDSETGAILLAGLSEAKAEGRPAHLTESAATRNEQFHLRLKRKLHGMDPNEVRLQPPRPRPHDAPPAPVLREGDPADAGVKPDAKEQVDAVCRAWAQDTGEPFVVLVARRGVIITHEAFGNDKDTGVPIERDYRADVASITKTVTALLFAQFLDQELIRLDDPVSAIFPDYPRDDPRVPTFRQCFTHTSGLSGHGVFGGVRNPHFENVVLNALDVNEPGRRYDYTGTGFELAAKAMEIAGGKCATRLYAEHLFGPLGLGHDVPMDAASTGARLTAFELATLAQLLCDRGSYGDRQFFSRDVFQSMLPEPLGERYPGIKEIEGIGLHWMTAPKPGAPPYSPDPNDSYLSPRTIGHGSLTSCMFFIDLERDLVIVQIRRAAGERFGEWAAEFYEAVVDGLDED